MAEAPSLRHLRGLRILVVEDNFLVAELIVDHLTEAGCEVVGPAERVEAALVLARAERLDGALLDVNLAGENSFPVAAELRGRGVRFAFLTGYGEAALPVEFRDAPRLAKPFEMDELMQLLSTMLVTP